MYKKYSIIILLALAPFLTKSQVLCSFPLPDGSCPNTSNDAGIPGSANYSVSPIMRVSAPNPNNPNNAPNLACVVSTGGFNTSGFSGGTLNMNDNYIELTLTASPGYYLNISSASFFVQRAGTNAPTSGRIYHNGSGSFTTYNEFPIQTGNSLINWTIFQPFSSSMGGVVKFRFYAWNTSGNNLPTSGTMRLDDITVNGTVTTVPMSGLWTSNATSDVFNTNTGNIGIGTITPLTKLDVIGDIRASGKMFIGTTAQDASILTDYSFAVNGNAIFNKIKIKSYSIWPDYVFENTYKLPSLEEIEAFIKKYKHLPDIPSQKEVQEKGIDVETYNAMFLKKLEEMTLYIIQLKKEIDNISRENELLKAKIELLQN